MVAVAAVAAACGGGEKVVVYDLAERLPVADRLGSLQVVAFGTPGAERFLGEGFYREARTGDEAAVWARADADLVFDWPQPAERAAILDAAPYAAVHDQRLELRLNGQPVGTVSLNDERYRYRLELPAAAQRPGENRLSLAFREEVRPSDVDPQDRDRRALSARLFGLTVGGAGDPGLDDLLRRGAPTAFGLERQDGAAVVQQVGPGVLRYALRLPDGGELRFTPQRHPLARTGDVAVVFRVAWECRAGPERELWSQTLRRGDEPSEAKVAIPACDAGRLSFRLGPESGERLGWGGWRAPRVLARRSVPGLDPAPFSQAESRAADGFRQALSGANVLLVILDAARASEVGAYGYGRDTTPELDRLASEGVVFERAFTPAVYTLGAMSSLWTSQQPDKHHGDLSFADRLPADRLTLAEVLTGARVPAAGFVANAMAGTAPGFERGFAEFHEVFRLFPDLGSRAGAFARVLPDWLDRHGTERFFLYVHFREPHFPYDPPAPFDTRFGPDSPLTTEQRRDRRWYTDVNQGRVEPTAAEIAHLVRSYDGNLAYADHELGVLRRALEERGLLERTLVVVTADHGEQLDEHGYISHSGQVYEQSSHVPLVVRFPVSAGVAGRRVPAMVSLLDLAPTILDAFGVDSAPARRAFTGRSLLPVIAGAPGRAAAVSRTVWDLPVYALRLERMKLILDTRTTRSLLFDLDSDPRESHDLAASDPVLADVMRQDLLAWLDAQRHAGPSGAPSDAAHLTREQCENLKALGYIGADVECPP